MPRNEAPPIYDFRDPRLFLIALFNHLKESRPELSVRKWADELGLPSPEGWVAVITGKRKIKLKHVATLAQSLGLDGTERSYFLAMVERQNAADSQEEELFDLLLSQLSPGKDFSVKRVESQEMFSQWTDAALLSLSRLSGFSLNATEARRILGDKADEEAIKSSLQKLLENGLLVPNQQDGSLRPPYQRITTRTGIRHEGARQYYRQVSELAAQEADKPMDNREFQCFSIAIHESNVPLFQELIRNLRVQMEKSASPEKNVVYQVNLQLFPLSGPLPDPARKSERRPENALPRDLPPQPGLSSRHDFR